MIANMIDKVSVSPVGLKLYSDSNKLRARNREEEREKEKKLKKFVSALFSFQINQSLCESPQRSTAA